jgi:hypothetical protein
METKLTIRVDYLGGPSPWGDQDIRGTLMGPDGEELWNHFSSSRFFLEKDLLHNFGRDLELSQKYPNGFSVEWEESCG